MHKHNGRLVIGRAEFHEPAFLTASDALKIDAWLRGRGIDIKSHRARETAASFASKSRSRRGLKSADSDEAED